MHSELCFMTLCNALYKELLSISEMTFKILNQRPSEVVPLLEGHYKHTMGKIERKMDLKTSELKVHDISIL